MKVWMFRSNLTQSVIPRIFSTQQKALSYARKIVYGVVRNGFSEQYADGAVWFSKHNGACVASLLEVDVE